MMKGKTPAKEPTQISHPTWTGSNWYGAAGPLMLGPLMLAAAGGGCVDGVHVAGGKKVARRCKT